MVAFVKEHPHQIAAQFVDMGRFVFDVQVRPRRFGAGGDTAPAGLDRADPATALMAQAFVVAEPRDIAASLVGGLHDGLAEGRMRVDRHHQVLEGGAHLDGEGAFGDELAGHGPDDPHAQHGAAAPVGDDLDQPVGAAQRARAAQGRQGEAPDVHLDALLLGLAASPALAETLCFGWETGTPDVLGLYGTGTPPITTSRGRPHWCRILATTDRPRGARLPGRIALLIVSTSSAPCANAATAAAQAANFPFCTIEPNVGDVAVPDARLDKLAEIAGSRQIIPTRMTFVDIAGLVKGASKGEGLGNQFLANIRECDAIAHVLRCFEDGDVTHVEGRVDPDR